MRESSEELKTLEAQLRAAYVSKELAAQIAEKKAAAIQEKVSFNLFNGSWQLLNLEILELETFKLKHLHQCFIEIFADIINTSFRRLISA